MGNRRESRDAQELKLMKEALATAGLDLYKGKIMRLADANKVRQADKAAVQAARQPLITSPAPGSSIDSATSVAGGETAASTGITDVPAQLPVETPFERAHRLTMNEPTGLIDYKSKLAKQGFTCFYLPGYGIEFRDSAKQLVVRFDTQQSSQLDKVFTKNSMLLANLSVAPKKNG